MTAAEPALGEVADLVALLDLEILDRGLFRGRNAAHGSPRPALYGGQVAGQALRAAGLTIPDDRFPHSLHGYFLRPGRPGRPVIFQVAPDRDGGSFSARHVRAVQNGDVIFSMLASFHVDEPSGDHDDLPATAVPTPEDLEPGGWDRLLQVREVTRTATDDDVHSDRMWVRTAIPLPGDRLIHACALTYLSDLGSGFGQVRPSGFPRGGPSIDHAMWFHDPIRVDDWVLLDLWPSKASGARGMYLGCVRDRHGRLGAMLGQEMLLRPGASGAGRRAGGT